jgi:membrane protein
MKFLKVLYKTIKKFLDDEPLEYASSIAFYTIFSLPAILMIAVYVASITFDDEVVRQNLIAQIQKLMGEQSANAVNRVLNNVNNVGDNLWTQIFGIGVLIFSGTTVFVTLQNGLNRIWKIKPKSNKEALSFLINRLLSLAMVISIGFLLLVSLVIDTLVAALNNVITELLSGYAYIIIAAVNTGISITIVALIFAMIFKYLPDAKIKWRDVWMGAFVTTILFTLGKFLIGFYLSQSPISTTYGAAGSLVLLLVWVYYSSIILLFGAEFTYVFSIERGEKVIPKSHAVLVKQVELGDIQEKEEENSNPKPN